MLVWGTGMDFHNRFDDLGKKRIAMAVLHDSLRELDNQVIQPHVWVAV